ncbi:MAG TPA: pyrroline-5-carboxylate reductase [Hyphomicrobiaceae bacterium]|nr:pyrroline-5-carboxylate reductase [Hyphomicrobiaceae bacterium]
MALSLDGTLLLAGAGNMGGALLAGWLEQGLAPSRIIVQDPSPPPRMTELLAKHRIRTEASIDRIDVPPAVMLVAVKPQIMDEVFPKLAKLAGPATVVLSVAAGKTIAGFERHLAPGAAVVRSIPNTPASVGRGITVAAANANVTAAQKAACQKLLESVGAVAWVDDEALIDPVTAVSGSGPAYVFYLCETLAKAGVAAGLEPGLALQLARWTVAGAGELLHRSDLTPDVLRQNVTSPNGTTFAALQVLMGEKGIQPVMTEAVAAATKRSRELAK